MPRNFKLKERPAGISLSFAVKEELVKVMTTELIGPLDSNLLVSRLEQIHSMVFEKIPGFPLEFERFRNVNYGEFATISSLL